MKEEEKDNGRMFTFSIRMDRVSHDAIEASNGGMKMHLEDEGITAGKYTDLASFIYRNKLTPMDKLIVRIQIDRP